jgi:hypothetical protein
LLLFVFVALDRARVPRLSRLTFLVALARVSHADPATPPDDCEGVDDDGDDDGDDSGDD